MDTKNSNGDARILMREDHFSSLSGAERQRDIWIEADQDSLEFNATLLRLLLPALRCAAMMAVLVAVVSAFGSNPHGITVRPADNASEHNITTSYVTVQSSAPFATRVSVE